MQHTTQCRFTAVGYSNLLLLSQEPLKIGMGHKLILKVPYYSANSKNYVKQSLVQSLAEPLISAAYFIRNPPPHTSQYLFLNEGLRSLPDIYRLCTQCFILFFVGKLFEGLIKDCIQKSFLENINGQNRKQSPQHSKDA